MTALHDLQRLVPPPTEPDDPFEHAGGHDITVHGRTIRLPGDFFEYLTLYGSGLWFDELLYVESPTSQCYEDFVDMGLARLKSAHAWERISYPVFPVDNGLFPWGMDDHASVLCWDTTGEPDKWTIVLLEHGGGTEDFDTSMSEFLYRAATNSVIPEAWSYESFEALTVDFRRRTRCRTWGST